MCINETENETFLSKRNEKEGVIQIYMKKKRCIVKETVNQREVFVAME